MISQDPKPGPFLEGARHFERGHENWSFYGVKIRGPSRLKLDFFTRDWARFISSMYLMYIVGKLLGKRYIVVLYFLSLFWPRWVNGPKFGLNHGQSCIINSHVWLTHHTAVYRNWAVLFWDYNFTITNLVLLIFFHFLLQKADINGDGYISADEYCRILREHGIDCTREEILQIMQIAGMFMLSVSCLECALLAS